MTINQVLTEVNELKPNVYSDDIKVRWISVLEGKLVEEIFRTHWLEGNVGFDGYSIDDLEKELLVPDTYADIYKYYIFAMMDANNQEAARYATSMSLFNNAYHDFAAYYNRNNMPIGMPLKVF